VEADVAAHAEREQLEHAKPLDAIKRGTTTPAFEVARLALDVT